MRETTSAAMPPCFDKWCKRFDDLFKTQAQKREFRHYLGGLLGESVDEVSPKGAQKHYPDGF
jgi:hypothetical protein